MGGAIFNAAGSVTITNSTLYGNAAVGGTGAGNGSAFGGAIFNLNGSLDLLNATIAGNSVAAGVGGTGGNADGGALYTLGMNNVFVNGTGTGATIGTAAGAMVTAYNTIFANSIGGSSDIVNNNTIISGSSAGNLFTEGLPPVPPVPAPALPPGSPPPPPAPFTQTTTAALALGTLGVNGGPTETMAIGTTSSAANAGDFAAAAGLTTDQRGPGFPRTTGTTVDVGAFEHSIGTFFEVTSTSDAIGTISGGLGTQVNPFLATTLRAAIAAADADIFNPNVIEFDPSLTGSGPATIALDTVGDTTAGPSAFGITDTITIEGPIGTSGLTIEGTGGMRLFYVGTSGSLTIDALTLSGGMAQGGSGHAGAAGMGGAIFNQGTLTLNDSTLSGNTAQGGNSTGFASGGGIGGNYGIGVGGGPNGGTYPGGNGGFGGGGGSNASGRGGNRRLRRRRRLQR